MNTARNEIKDNLKEWASKNEDVLCVIIAGSQGSKHNNTDEYSDIDVAVFARRRKHYDKNLDWMREIGSPSFHYKDDTKVPGMTGIHKIYFTNGTQMDLFFWNRRILFLGFVYLWIRKNTILLRFAPRILKKIIECRFSYFSKWIYRGYSIVVDKKGYRSMMDYIDNMFKYKQTPFTQEKLQEIISRFWAFAHYSAIYIYRNELFAAKTVGDRILKAHLLFLIELYAKLIKGRDYDVFENGRRLEQWAPAFITTKLEAIYGRYDAADAWRALMETIDLFSMICHTLLAEHPEIRIENPEEHFRKLIKGIESKMVDTENLIS